MSSRNDPRRVRFPSRPQNDPAEEPVDFVFDEDADQPGSEDVAIGLECAMPALQAYLRDIAELDALIPSFRGH